MYAIMTKLHITCYLFWYGTLTKTSALSHSWSPPFIVIPSHFFQLLNPGPIYQHCTSDLKWSALQEMFQRDLDVFGQCTSCQGQHLLGCHLMEVLQAVDHIFCKSLSPFILTYSSILVQLRLLVQHRIPLHFYLLFKLVFHKCFKSHSFNLLI